MGRIRYPYLRYEQIVEAAEGFLEKHHRSKDLPVPIERIVEGMGIDIVPFPGLHRAYDTDGFTTSDLTAIYVEEYVYLNVETRYRFTLAHELGHVVLHSEFYRTLGTGTGSQWCPCGSYAPAGGATRYRLASLRPQWGSLPAPALDR